MPTAFQAMTGHPRFPARARKTAFEQARAAGEHESQDAYRFDALIGLANGEHQLAPAAPVARVRVDVTALLRGKAAPGEVCEIPGVGPVPVSAARETLSHGLLELVLHDGTDVQAIVTRTRHVPDALAIAICHLNHAKFGALSRLALAAR